LFEPKIFNLGFPSANSKPAASSTPIKSDDIVSQKKRTKLALNAHLFLRKEKMLNSYTAPGSAMMITGIKPSDKSNSPTPPASPTSTILDDTPHTSNKENMKDDQQVTLMSFLGFI
jgi:hypothetical protein